MKGRILGHPIHPMLIVFPLGLLPTALIFDLIGLARDENIWFTVAFYMIGAGIVGALAAAVFGLIDWLAIPSRTRAKTIGLWHGAGNLVVVALFLASFSLRYDEPANPNGLGIVLSVLGVALALVTGWLGGELVDRLGVGIHKGAHYNSPSSLSNLPAAANAEDYTERRAGGMQ